MFGRLSQLAQNVQHSFNADEGGTQEHGSPSKNTGSSLTDHLQSQLEESEERNKSINHAFKKLLKEKEEEIKTLKEKLSGSDSQVSENKTTTGDPKDFDALLRRKTEEYKILIEQKDESIQSLMARVHEAEDLRDKVEEQERKNTEKLMFELAERIRAHETIQRKMEEMRFVMEEKDNAVHNMADQMAAQDGLLKAREEAIKKLKRMARGGEASEEMIVTLQKAVQGKDEKINQMAQIIDKLEIDKKLLDAKINNRDGVIREIEDKDAENRSLLEKLNDSLRKFEMEAKEKNDLRDQLNKVGSELSKEIDVKDSEIKQLEEQLKLISKEKIDLKTENEYLSDKLRNCQNIGTEKSQKIEEYEKRINALEKEIDNLERHDAKLSEELANAKEDLISKEKEIKEQQERFDEQIQVLNNVSENEKGNAASFVQELEAVRRELDASKEESMKWQRDNEQLIIELDTVQNDARDKVSAHDGENMNLKAEVSEFHAAMRDLNDKIHRNEELIASKDELNKELSVELKNVRKENLDRISVLENENEELKVSNKELSSELDKVMKDKQKQIMQLENDNNELKLSKKELDEFIKDNQKQISELENENRELKVSTTKLDDVLGASEHMKTENEELKKKLTEYSESGKSSQEEIISLNEKCASLVSQVKELESAMDHMVEKLNIAELKMNESVLENDELRQRLRQGLEEKATVVDQKTEMEIALEEFVRSTESRKKRSGRRSEDDADGIRSTPSEGVSGYNTPVFREESPRHSSYMETYPSQQASMVSSAFEGRAIADIFKLVEDERCTLEEKVAVLTKEKNILEEKFSELEDYLELEKQKFKTVSEDVSQQKQSIQKDKENYIEKLSTIQQENSSLRELQVNFANEKKSLEGIIYDRNSVIKEFEINLKTLQDQLTEKSSEVDKMAEEVQRLEKEQTTREELVEKLAKQNRQMKNKLKELLKEKSEKDLVISDKESRINELEDLNLKLNESVAMLAPLESSLKERQSTISELEEESYLKNMEVMKLKENLNELKQNLMNLEEMKKTEIFEINEKLFEAEQVAKEQEEALRIMSVEKGSRLQEVQNLQSMASSLKEEILKMNDDLSLKIEEVDKLNNLLAVRDENIAQLTKDNVKLDCLIQDLEASKESLEIQLRDASEKMFIGEAKNTKNSEIITQLETKLASVDSELMDVRNDSVGKSEYETALKKLDVAEEENLKIKESLASMKDENAKILEKLVESENENVHSKESMKNKKEEFEKTLKKLHVSENESIQFKGNLQSMKEELDVALKKLKEAESENIQLKEDSDNTKEEFEKALKKLNESEQDKFNLEKTLQIMKEELLKQKDDSNNSSNEFSHKLTKKNEEIERLVISNGNLEAKINELEEMMSGNDVSLREVIDSKNKEMDVIKDGMNELRNEHSKTQEQAFELDKKLLEAKQNLADKNKEFDTKEAAMVETMNNQEAMLIDLKTQLNELEAMHSEKARLHEISLKRLSSADDELACEQERKENLSKENDQLKLIIESLANEAREAKVLNENFASQSEAKQAEVDSLRNEFEEESKRLKCLLEEAEKLNEDHEKLIIDLQKFNEELKSQLGVLDLDLSKISKEKEDLLLEKSNSVKELDDVRRRMSEIEEEARSKEVKLNDVVRDLEENLQQKQSDMNSYSYLETDLNEKLNHQLEMCNKLEEDNKRLVEDLVAKDEDLVRLDSEMKSFKAETEQEIERMKIFESDVDNLKNKECEYQELIKALKTALSDKDNEVTELMKDSEILKATIAEKSKELDRVQSDTVGQDEKCFHLQESIDILRSNLEKCDEEFDKERDMFANKLSELNTEIQALKLSLEGASAENLNMKNELLAKDEDVSKMAADFKSKFDEISASNLEENDKLKQLLEEKSKAMDDYKARVLKKMKSMKDEMKKSKTNDNDIAAKESQIAELQGRLEVIENEKQSLISSVESANHKLIEMESLNQSREENLRNYETEISRSNRFIQDKNEEITQVKEILRNAMEEKQSLLETVEKRDEKVRILQEQLIANEEDMMTSFNEKEAVIDSLKETVSNLEESKGEIELQNSQLSSSILEKQEYNDNERDRLNDEIEKLGKENTLLAAKIKENESELELLQEQLSEKCKALDNMNTDGLIAPYLEKITALQAEIENVNKADDSSLLAPYIEQISTLQSELESKNKTGEEFRGKVAKKLKSLKEENNVLNTTVGDLRSQVQQKTEEANELNNSVKSKGEDLDSSITNAEKLKQRLGDKEEELFAVKEMMQNSMQQLQMIQEDSDSKTNMIRGLQNELVENESVFNDKIAVILDESSSLKAEIQSKDEEIRLLRDEVSIEKSNCSAVRDTCDEKIREIENIKQQLEGREHGIGTMEKDPSPASNEDQKKALKESAVILTKELDAVKLKLAKAIKRMGTMKKDLQSKEETIVELEKQVKEIQSANSGKEVNVEEGPACEEEASQTGKEAAEMKSKLDVSESKTMTEIKTDVDVSKSKSPTDESSFSKDETDNLIEEIKRKDLLIVSLQEKIDSLKLDEREIVIEAVTESDVARECLLGNANEKLIPVIEEAATEQVSQSLEAVEQRPEVIPDAGGTSQDSREGNIEEAVVLQSAKSFEAVEKLPDSRDNPLGLTNEEIEKIIKDRNQKEIKLDELSVKHSKTTETLEKAKKKISQLKKIEAKLAKENEELKQKISANIETSNALEVKSSELEEKIKCFENELSQAMQSKEKIELKNTDLKNLVEMLAEEKHELDSEMKDMLSEIKEVMDIKNTLLQDLNEAKDKLARVEHDCQGLREALSEKEALLASDASSKEMFDSLRKRVEDLDKESSSLKETESRLEFKIGDLSWELEGKFQEVSELESSKKEMKELLDEKDLMNSDLNVKLTEAEGSIAALKSEVGKLSAELESKIGELHDSEKLYHNMEEMLREKESLNIDLNFKLAEALDSATALPTKEFVANLEQKIVELQDDNDSLSSKKLELETALASQEDKYKLADENLSSNYENLKIEFDEINRQVDRLQQEIADKDIEAQQMRESFSKQEIEMKKMIDDEAEANKSVAGEMEALKILLDENRKSHHIEKEEFQKTIDELKESFNSEKDLLMKGELSLLEEKFQKEQDIMMEKLKIEKSELVKSFDDNLQSTEELKGKIAQLESEKEHKDTVIGKLKVKLKQTIKDRDVIKMNSQSEIERLSQEKDIVFNEFQAKIQQTDSDFASLKSKFSDLEQLKSRLEDDLNLKERRNEDIVEKLKNMERLLENANNAQAELIKSDKSLKEKLVLMEKEVGENNDFKKMLEEESADKNDLRERLTLMEKEAQEKNDLKERLSVMEKDAEDQTDLIEKYEWESSEKEDKIRDLERNLKSLHEDKCDWEELKNTLEDTIDVKEALIVDLKKELESFKISADESLKLKVEELSGVEDDKRHIEEEIQKQQKEKADLMKKVENLEAKISEVLTQLDSDDTDVVVAVLEYRKSCQEQIGSKVEEIKKLMIENESMKEGSKNMEDQLLCYRKELEELRTIALSHIEAENDDIPLQEALEEIVKMKNDLLKDNKGLNDDLIAEKETSSLMKNKYEEQSALLEEIQRMNYEEKLLDANKKLQEKESECSQLKDEIKSIEIDVRNVKNMLSEKKSEIEKICTEKNNLELSLSEMKTQLDFNELELQQLKIDKENSNRQLEILVQEAENFESTKMPELQSVISMKNQTMLELRENFSDVISDKDSIISNLRDKLSDLHQTAADAHAKQQEDTDKITAILKQKEEEIEQITKEKDERINKLTTEFSSVKKKCDWLTGELSHVIKEKNTIGGSIQTQFESISKGLRGDIELFFEDKKNFETQFQIERLQLERQIAELQDKIRKMENKLEMKDKYLMELNMVKNDLKLRVESAADILSKESYYEQLEQKLEESYTTQRQAIEMASDLENKLRKTEEELSEHKLKIDVMAGEKDLLVLNYEGRLTNAEELKNKACQDLKFEFEDITGKNNNEIESLKAEIDELGQDYEEMETKMREEYENEIYGYKEFNDSLKVEILNLKAEKEELRSEIMNEAVLSADAKMLRMKKDFDNVILHRDRVNEENASKINELTEKISSLTVSNKNLSGNLYAMEKDNKKLLKDAGKYEIIITEMKNNQKEEIDNILVSKGKDFKDLRAQFDEALADKDEILGNLRKKVDDLRSQIDEKFAEVDKIKAEKNELMQEEVRRDLSVEKLKIGVESLLGVIGGLKIDDNDEENEATMGDDERGVDELLTQYCRKISEVETSVAKAKTHLDSYLAGIERKREIEKDKIDDSEEVTKNVECELDEMRGKIVELEAENEKKQVEKEEYGKIAKRIETEMQELRDQVLKLQEENENLRSENAGRNKEIMDDIQSQMDEMHGKIIELEAENENLRSQMKEDQHEEESNDIGNELEEMRRKVIELEAENASLQSVNTKVEKSEEITKKLESEIQEMRDKILSLESEKNELLALTANTKSTANDVSEEVLKTGSDVTESVNSFDLPSSITNMIGMPRAMTGLQILASETMKTQPDVEVPESEAKKKKNDVDIEDVIVLVEDSKLDTANLADSRTIEDLKKEVENLNSVISELKTRIQNAESTVRKEFDDILQNLREDLQTSLKENSLLQAELFMLKNMQGNEIGNQRKAQKVLKIESQTQTDLESRDSQLSIENRQRSEDGVKEVPSVDASMQTDINVTQQTGPKKNENITEHVRIKRYSSSERLPEVVEDTLVSKMDYEQLQTYSDSSLDGEAFAAHPNLQLRITDDQDESDKPTLITDLRNEVESLKSKLDQNKRIIIKLKQMGKKYKSELSELQLEKFEQIRVYEDELNTLKQDGEEASQEKLRKDQEIRSLREEVRVLVKEKTESSANVFHTRNNLQQKVAALQQELSSMQREHENLKIASQKQKENLDLQKTEIDEKTILLKNQTDKIARLEADLNTSKTKADELEGSMSKEKVEAATENPGFDDEVIRGYSEEIERKDIELSEAFDLIRALEKNQENLEQQHESQAEELNVLISTKESLVERMSGEKLEIDKSFQEMRAEVQRTVEERDNIVGYWRNEAGRIMEESEQNRAELIGKSESIQRESEAKIIELDQMIGRRNEEITALKELLKSNGDVTRDIEQQNQQFIVDLENTRNELEKALQNCHLAEDKLAFYEHQIESFKNERNNEIFELRKEIETADGIIKNLRNGSESKELLVLSLQEESQRLKREVEKHQKKAKKSKRDLESSRLENEDISQRVRQEMEKIVDEIQNEKSELYSELLMKERALQEARIHADQLVREKENWISSVRVSDVKSPDGVETERLLQIPDGRSKSPELEGMTMQIQQLKREKDLTVQSLENKLSQLTNEFFDLQKMKRMSDLEIAELKTKLKDSENVVVDEKKIEVGNKNESQEKLETFKSEIRNIKGDFEVLKNEAANFTTQSRFMLNDLETELTGFVMNAAKAQKQSDVQPIKSPLSPTPESVGLKSFLSDDSSFRLDIPHIELEDAKQQIAMLEESLYSWKDRCVDLEEQLQRHELEKLPNKSGSQEFLINLEDDEGPSIESTRAGLSRNAQRLMKYTTSGMKLKNRARSFFSQMFSKTRGPIPGRKLLLMMYLLAIHVLAFMSVYSMLTA